MSVAKASKYMPTSVEQVKLQSFFVSRSPGLQARLRFLREGCPVSLKPRASIARGHRPPWALIVSGGCFTRLLY